MNDETLKAVTRHGEALLRAFPNAVVKDPVKLCQKLRRIEARVSRVTTAYCNAEADLATVDQAANTAEHEAKVILGATGAQMLATGLFVNRDPRGYALKVEDAWARVFNQAQYKAGLPALHTDMGGYGIVAPDLTHD